MKKILITILISILFIPSLKADCDYQNEVRLGKLASSITYEYKYDKTHNNFTLTLYNVSDELYITYNQRIIAPTDGKVTINNLNQGTYLSLPVEALKGSCNGSLMTLYIILPYFNKYYNSVECKDYIGKIKICTDEFLSYEPNDELLTSNINNYLNGIKNEEVKEDNQNVTILEQAKEFVNKWGIKIGLSLITTVSCVVYFQVKIRKLKHGL